MPLSAEQFKRQLIESGLMSAADLDTWIGNLPHDQRPQDGEKLARLLVKHKKLTAFQAQQVYSGKGKSLVLGNYVVLEKLGQGGMGMVLKAVHRRMDRLVALKILSPAVTKSPEAVQRFLREVKAAAKLEHANIVTAYDADEAGGTHFLVMQYVEGVDLAAYVRTTGPMPPERAIGCVLQAAQGLAYAHARGVIHRDIKPSNLLLDRHGTVKVLDMGLARLDVGDDHQDQLTGTGQIMGTVDYMAPEQALDTRTADQRADVYALGMTLFYLLTGRLAYEEDTVVKKLLAHQNQPVPKLRAVCPQATAELESVFTRMVAKTPQTRYQSMADVIANLQHLVPSGAASSAAAAAAAWGKDPVPLSSSSGPQLIVQTAAPARANTNVGLEGTRAVRSAEVDTDPQTQRALPMGRTNRSRRTATKSAPSPRMIAAGVGGIAFLLLIGAVLLFYPSSPPADDVELSLASAEPEDGFVSLFDGRTLEGWSGKAPFWSVRDGAITGETTAENPTDVNTCLIWRGGELRDFELRLKFRIMSGNSGVQYRSEEVGDHVVKGYQADIATTDPFIGSLYEERGRRMLANRCEEVVITADGTKQVVGSTCDNEEVLASLKNEGWNQYVIRAVGNELTQTLNGHVTAKCTDGDSSQSAMAGILALQLHTGAPMLVQFKDIQLKHLRSPEGTLAAAATRLAPAGSDASPRPDSQTTGRAALRAEFSDPEVELRIKGTNTVLRQSNQQQEVPVDAGRHALVVRKGTVEFETNPLTFKSGETVTVRVSSAFGTIAVRRGTTMIGWSSEPASASSARGSGAAQPAAPRSGWGWSYSEWQSLFDGRSLAGWTGDTQVLRVNSGVLRHEKQRGVVLAPGTFRDFELELDFRLANGGNSGIGISYAGHGDPSKNGLEIQLVDDEAYSNIGPSTRSGAIFNLAAAQSGHFRRWPQWNTIRVRSLGPDVEVELNDVLVTKTTRTALKITHPKHAGLKIASGRICLFPLAGPSEYRNFRIREARWSALNTPAPNP